jgi:hypothetical protein
MDKENVIYKPRYNICIFGNFTMKLPVQILHTNKNISKKKMWYTHGLLFSSKEE